MHRTLWMAHIINYKQIKRRDLYVAFGLSLCSVIGTIIIGMGYFTVIWGQMKEQEVSARHGFKSVESNSDDEKVPLLKDEENNIV